MSDAAKPAKGNWTATIVAVAILAGLAALVAPGSTSLTANEKEAVRALRTVAAAQAKARERDGRYWTTDVRGLFGLPPEIAQADSSSIDRRALAGYWFVAMRAGDGYAVCAYPTAYPHAGRRTFIVGGDGIVWMKDASGAPITQRPRDPVSEGWKPAE